MSSSNSSASADLMALVICRTQGDIYTTQRSLHCGEGIDQSLSSANLGMLGLRNCDESTQHTLHMNHISAKV